MTRIGRRVFMKTAAGGLASVAVVPGKIFTRRRPGGEVKSPAKFSLGLASYSFRAFDLKRTAAMTRRLGLKRILLKDMHLPLDSTPAEIAGARALIEESGLDLYGCGVVYMRTESEVDRAFAYAAAAAMKMIVCAPEPGLLAAVERNVKRTAIRAAIHNHGPGDRLYPTPASAYEKVISLDERIGLCLDIGHAMRAGINPAEAAAAFFDRLLDVHIKDVSRADRDGQTVEIGRGVIDITGFIRKMIELGYAGTLHFEFEKDEKDPLPGVAESVGYVRGVLAAL